MSEDVQTNVLQAFDPDVVCLWTVDLASPIGPQSLPADLLSHDEIEQAKSFKLDAPRQRFVHTRVALRAILAHLLGCGCEEVAFEIGINGKPRLNATMVAEYCCVEPKFNVAHSGDMGIVGFVWGREIGVDVEQLRPVKNLESIAQRYFHPREVEAILDTPPALRDEAFLRCWTCKEAILKATGRGIAGPLNEFEVPFQNMGISPVAVTPSKQFNCWLRPLAVGPGYVGAVALLGELRRIRWMTLSSKGVVDERCE